MKSNITETYEHAMLRLSIRDVCNGYESAPNPEEAEAIITLEDLQENILKQLEGTQNEKGKQFVTHDFLKAELKRNNLTETLFTTDEGIKEVWFLRRKQFK